MAEQLVPIPGSGGWYPLRADIVTTTGTDDVLALEVSYTALA